MFQTKIVSVVLHHLLCQMLYRSEMTNCVSIIVKYTNFFREVLHDKFGEPSFFVTDDKDLASKVTVVFVHLIEIKLQNF